MENRQIISALIGLAGAVRNAEKTENTDRVVRKALISEESEELAEEIRKEKYHISPGCASCPHPCGNTSDFDMEKYDEAPEEILLLKQEVYKEMQRIAEKTEVDAALPENIYKAIAFLGYNLQEASYRNLLEELRK